MDLILSSIYLAVYSPTGYLAMISGIRPDIELIIRLLPNIRYVSGLDIRRILYPVNP